MKSALKVGWFNTVGLALITGVDFMFHGHVSLSCIGGAAALEIILVTAAVLRNERNRKRFVQHLEMVLRQKTAAL